MGQAEEDNVDAMTTYSDGEAAVLLVRRKGATLCEDASILAHEACHVAMEHMRWLGDDTWGDEALAYAVQAVTLGLMEAHVLWMTRKRV